MRVEIKYLFFLLRLTFVQSLGQFYFVLLQYFLREGAEGVKPQGGGRLHSACTQPRAPGGTWASPQLLGQMGRVTALPCRWG